MKVGLYISRLIFFFSRQSLENWLIIIKYKINLLSQTRCISDGSEVMYDSRDPVQPGCNQGEPELRTAAPTPYHGRPARTPFSFSDLNMREIKEQKTSKLTEENGSFLTSLEIQKYQS